MKTKDKLLSLLEENRGSYFSGEEIAEKLSVTRAAVWKAVKSLREEGYQIDAVQNKGYCLAVQTDILSSQGIRKYLGPVCKDLELEILAEVDSTNAWIRQKAAVGAEEGCTIIANEQTCGKGRWGRSFYSPAGTGIYMSILLRPQGWSPEKAVRLTTMAAVSACEAAEEISGEKAEIKWVNDIYMRGKKVSGILTEASFSLESGCVDYAVLGIGFNVYKPEGGFPEELKHTAGAVFDSRQNDGKNRLWPRRSFPTAVFAGRSERPAWISGSAFLVFSLTWPTRRALPSPGSRAITVFPLREPAFSERTPPN